MSSDLLSPKDAANRLGVSVKTLNGFVRDGELRIGSRYAGVSSDEGFGRNGQRIRKFVFYSGSSRHEKLAIPGIIGLLDYSHAFVEALALLIKRASGSVSADETDQMANVQVECSRPTATASIDLYAQDQSNLYVGSAFRSTLAAAGAGLKPLRHTGIRHKKSIDGDAPLIIGLAFRENGLNYLTAEKSIEAIVGAAKAKKGGT
jgi:hypothetical protein